MKQLPHPLFPKPSLITPNRGGRRQTNSIVMKKLLTFAALCFGMFTVANAQYSPEKGDIAVEIGFTPFKAGGETFQLNEGMVKARWFFSDKNALRLKLGLDIDNTTRTDDESYHPVNTKNTLVYDQTTEVKTKQTSFSIMLGYERHLFTKGRFDVYAGLELGYLMNKTSGSFSEEYEGTQYDSNNERAYVTNYSVSADFNNAIDAGSFYSYGLVPGFTPNYANTNAKHNFVANLFAGVDFYVWKNLYLGAELGLSFKTGKTPNAYASYDINYNEKDYTGPKMIETIYTETSDQDAGTLTQKLTVDGTLDTTYDGETKYGQVKSTKITETSFKLYVEPAVRIGWKF